MAKQLYEEALADIKSLKEVAENNAKQAVFEAVVPRIRDLIEQQILSTDDDISVDDNDIGLSVNDVVGDIENEISQTTSMKPGEVVHAPEDVQFNPSPIVGNQPLDVQSNFEMSPDNQEYVLDVNAIDQLSQITEPNDSEDEVNQEDSIINQIDVLEARACGLELSKKKLRNSNGISERITKLLTLVENTYNYVQESINDSNKKSMCENRLEKLYANLKELKESKKMRKLREADELDLETSEDGQDLTIKVKGLGVSPDKLDGASVELIGGEDKEGSDEELDLDLGDEDEEGSDEELDLDSSEDEDEVLEIDEGMLRRALMSMKLNESEKVPSCKGTRPGKPEFKNFGGSVDEEDLLGESDEVDMEEACNEEDEELDSQLKKESRLQTALRSRMRRLQKEGTTAQGRRRQLYRTAWVRTSKRLSESRSRSARLMSESRKRNAGTMNESRRVVASRQINRSNIDSRQSAVQNTNEAKIRKELAEKNLLNAKLIFTNKVLQNESLNNHQKALVIEKLDEAKSVKDAKLVYDSLISTLSEAKKEKETMTESRVIGSSSSPTRSASSTLNEGIETARWAKLAGIK